MAKERTSVRMQAQIKNLSEQDYSIRSIARILKLSRKTVRKFLGGSATEAEASEPTLWIEAWPGSIMISRSWKGQCRFGLNM